MDKEALKELLPHREPMLLLDDAEVVDGMAVGHVHVRGDEFFLQGHFPGNPVVPGVILCEMLAQNCCVLMGENGGANGKLTLYTSLDKVRFRHPVVPGDTVELRCSLTKQHGPFFFAHGEAFVEGQLACKADMSFALMDADKAGIETGRPGAGA